VGNVAYSSNEEELTNLFAKYGNVLSTEIKRGFAFIKFDTIEAAQSAVEGLDNLLFNGRNLRVNFSKSEPHPNRQASFQPNVIPNQNVNVNSQQPQQQRVPYKENSIHVANLPYHITEENLRQEFEAYGIISIHIIRTRNCFAIIELSSEDNTAKALEQKRSLVIEGREITVSRQVELPERNINHRGRGGRGRGFRGRGIYRRGGGFPRNEQTFQRNEQTFVLENNLHNNNMNNNNMNSNGNSPNSGMENSQRQQIFNNNKYRGSYRYRGDIFGGRGSFGGRGQYRGRGQFRPRGRGGFHGRVRNNDLFDHSNESSE